MTQLPQSRSPNRIRVLFMDDEPLVRSSMERMLRTLGCEVKLVGDGSEAIHEFFAASTAGFPFDLV
ncbi:MAG: response regulator, partial [Calditrichaeota bacterium]